MSNGEGSEIRERLKMLAEVSLDLDRHSQLSKTASHPIQAQQVRKRIDELTKQQASIMNGLVAEHPSEEKRANFHELGAKLESLTHEIRGCEDKERLVDLEGQIEATVDSWVHAFQVIASELSGVKPPDRAVYDK